MNDTHPETPCHPARVSDECGLCKRWRIAPEVPAERRQFVVIDASSLGRDKCPMYSQRDGAQ